MTKIITSKGPKTAELVFIGESPAAEEVAAGEPFVGRSGKLLNIALRQTGIDRTQCYMMNVVPVRAPGDKFANHTPADLQWGKDRAAAELRELRNAKVVVALGANPTEFLLGAKPPIARDGKDGFIGEWRGSVIPASALDNTKPEDYVGRYVNPIKSLPKGAVVVPTYHPAAILRQFTWHPWLSLDIERAASVVKNGVPPRTYRKWSFDDVEALNELAASGVDIISVDTEMNGIVGLATEDEVHVFTYDDRYWPALNILLTSDRILKVAHNWLHDYAWIRKSFGITVARPYFDTQGGAHELNNALQKELSPHIATRFTNWPYHKFLSNIDQHIYCGMDAVVCFDAYEPQIRELSKRGLYQVGRPEGSMPSVAEFDHKLLTPLMEMQAKGFMVDEVQRQVVEKELKEKVEYESSQLAQLVKPIIEKRYHVFKKPHLFFAEKKCACCGGGKTQRAHCAHCGGVEIVSKVEATSRGFRTIKDFKNSLPQCRTCTGTGKISQALEFNADSSDQLADVLYRGLRITPRRYKKAETVKAAQLDAIKHRHPIIAKVVEVSGIRADYDTIRRLTASSEHLLHCVFDPFGTGSGRVAGKEGLVEIGTNPMNLPLSARRFVVPREGYTFLYPDMAQIEARAVAVLSKDKGLLSAFTDPIDWPGNPKHGKVDSHTKVVQLMAKGGLIITRDLAKRLVYAAMYGARAPQLTVELNAESFRKGVASVLTVQEVQYMLDTFFRVFSGVRDWQKKVCEEVLRTRILRCPFTNRERTWTGYIVEMNKKSPQYGELKYEIAKQAWSFLPQNIGAWILGLGLIDMYYNTDEWGKLLQPTVHVHDALLLEVPIERVREAMTMASNILTRDVFGISFPCEMKAGMTWLEASTKDADTFLSEYGL